MVSDKIVLGITWVELALKLTTYESAKSVPLELNSNPVALGSDYHLK